MAESAERRHRMVLGPEPHEGWPVLLSESRAESYLEELSLLWSVTMRDFFETQEEWVTQEFVDENGEEALDAPFDVERVPGYGDGLFPPNPRTWMVSEFENDPDLDGLLDGLVALYDSMGSNPVMVIEADDVEEIRARLVSAGYDVVRWETLVEQFEREYDAERSRLQQEAQRAADAERSRLKREAQRASRHVRRGFASETGVVLLVTSSRRERLRVRVDDGQYVGERLNQLDVESIDGVRETSKFEDAVDELIGHLHVSKSRIQVISVDDDLASHLVFLLRRFASLATDGLKVNGRGVTRLIVPSSGEQILVPADPLEWPGHRRVNESVVAIDDIYLGIVPRRPLEVIGVFPNDADGLERADAFLSAAIPAFASCRVGDAPGGDHGGCVVAVRWSAGREATWDVVELSNLEGRCAALQRSGQAVEELEVVCPSLLPAIAKLSGVVSRPPRLNARELRWGSTVDGGRTLIPTRQWPAVATHLFLARLVATKGSD